VTQNQFSHSANQLHHLCPVTQNQFSHSLNQLHHLCAVTQSQFSHSRNQLHHLLCICCTIPLHNADNSCDIPVPSGNSCKYNCDWGMPPNYGISYHGRILWNSVLIMQLFKWNQNDWPTDSMQQIPSWQASSFQSRNFPHFMEHKCSLPYSQQHATCVFLETD
jgi:hypothetical protein